MGNAITLILAIVVLVLEPVNLYCFCIAIEMKESLAKAFRICVIARS